MGTDAVRHIVCNVPAHAGDIAGRALTRQTELPQVTMTAAAENTERIEKAA